MPPSAADELSSLLGAPGVGSGGKGGGDRPGLRPPTSKRHERARARALAGAVVGGLIEQGHAELARKDTAVRRRGEVSPLSSADAAVLARLDADNSLRLRGLVSGLADDLVSGAVKAAPTAPDQESAARLAMVVDGLQPTPRDCLLLALLHVTKNDVAVLSPYLVGSGDRRIRNASKAIGRSDPVSRAIHRALRDSPWAELASEPFDVLLDLVT